MAVGDAFDDASLSPYEWAHFAHQCGLPFRLVADTLHTLSGRVLNQLDELKEQVAAQRVPRQIADTVAATVAAISRRQFELAPKIASFKPSDFA